MKLSILLIFSLGIFLPYQAMSQCEICDSSAVLKKGIYRNLKEFKANKPSGTSKFTVMKAPLSFALDDADFATYKLLLDNPDSYKKNDSIWGFCDGKNVYILDGKYKYKKRNSYNKLKFIGRYCTYDVLINTSAPGTGGVPVYTGSYTATKALNINNGGSWILERQLVRTILKSDSDLAKEFEDAKRKNKKLESFIIKYSLKHQDEIK